jgi:multidrug efflux system outer membrane protein
MTISAPALTRSSEIRLRKLDTASLSAQAAGDRGRTAPREQFGGYLDELGVQRALLSAGLTMVQLRADQMNAFVALYQALGGEWDVAD